MWIFHSIRDIPNRSARASKQGLKNIRPPHDDNAVRCRFGFRSIARPWIGKSSFAHVALDSTACGNVRNENFAFCAIPPPLPPFPAPSPLLCVYILRTVYSLMETQTMQTCPGRRTRECHTPSTTSKTTSHRAWVGTQTAWCSLLATRSVCFPRFHGYLPARCVIAYDLFRFGARASLLCLRVLVFVCSPAACWCCIALLYCSIVSFFAAWLSRAAFLLHCSKS